MTVQTKPNGRDVTFDFETRSSKMSGLNDDQDPATAQALVEPTPRTTDFKSASRNSGIEAQGGN